MECLICAFRHGFNGNLAGPPLFLAFSATVCITKPIREFVEKINQAESAGADEFTPDYRLLAAIDAAQPHPCAVASWPPGSTYI